MSFFPHSKYTDPPFNRMFHSRSAPETLKDAHTRPCLMSPATRIADNPAAHTAQSGDSAVNQTLTSRLIFNGTSFGSVQTERLWMLKP